MAKLKNGILGPISGKLNGYITSTWRNVNYIKKASPPNHRPKSEAQLAQQEKFKFVNNMVKPMRPYITNGFQHLAIDKTEMSLAFSLSYKAVDGVSPDLTVDYNKVFISQGKLTPLQGVTVQQIAANEIELTWDIDYLDPMLNSNDQVMLMVYCPNKDAAEGICGVVNRSAQKCSFTLFNKMIGQRLEVFVGATAINRRDAANSVYVGSITLPVEIPADAG